MKKWFAIIPVVASIVITVVFFELKNGEEHSPAKVISDMKKWFPTQLTDDEEINHHAFLTYLAQFGKSYKSKETFEMRKREFLATSEYISRFNARGF